MLRACFYGEISTTKQASGTFSLSELTNPSDQTHLVNAKATVDELRTSVAGIGSLGVALAAAHPSDTTIFNVMAEVSAACQPETSSGVLTATVINAALGSFLRELSSKWSDFQTNKVKTPTAKEAWEEARKDNAVESAHRKELALAVVELKANDAKSAKAIKDLTEKNKSLEERLKKLEQARGGGGGGGGVRDGQAGKPPGAPPGDGQAPTLKVLRADVYHSKQRLQAAEKEAETAQTDATSDAPAKKAAVVELKAKLAKAEQAFAAAQAQASK